MINLAADSEHVVAWNQCSVQIIIIVAISKYFTDLSEICGFLLSTLVSVYGSSSVYHWVNQVLITWQF